MISEKLTLVRCVKLGFQSELAHAFLLDQDPRARHVSLSENFDIERDWRNLLFDIDLGRFCDEPVSCVFAQSRTCVALRRRVPDPHLSWQQGKWPRANHRMSSAHRGKEGN